MIVYFSGTGNSRCAAQLLARQLGDGIFDAGIQIKAGERGQLCSERPWVFVAPTYGWQMPHIFADYLRAAVFSGSRAAYFVLTCGSETGNAGRKRDWSIAARWKLLCQRITSPCFTRRKPGKPRRS